jgi:hypothetical protein
VTSRLGGRFAGVVVVGVWAVGDALAAAVPLRLVACGVVAVLFAASAHAVLVGLYLRLIGSIATTFGLRRRLRDPAATATAVVVAMAVAYWYAAASDGLARQVAVEAVFLLGLAVYATRRDLVRQVKARVLAVGR